MMFNRKTNTVFLDLDGVLADFDKFIIDNLGHKPSDEEMWDMVKHIDRFYYKLPLTPYALKLVKFVETYADNIEILTAIPRKNNIPSAEEDKREWVERYFGKNIKFNIGPYSKDKWKHAKPGDILIDDRADNIADWISKGNGIGILHEYGNLEDTKNQFLHVMRNYR